MRKKDSIILFVTLLILFLGGIYFYKTYLFKLTNLDLTLENTIKSLDDKEENNTAIEEDKKESLNKLAEDDFYKKCLKEDDIYKRSRCFMPYFKEITLKQDTITALNLVQKLETDGIIKECHLPAHIIGNTSFDKFNGDVVKAFSSCSPGEEFKYNACFEGCFHGAIERYVEKSEDLNEVMKSISKVCEGIQASSNPRTICMHGLGHGLVSHDITKVVESAKLCRQLTDPNDLVQCLRGVYMENINNYISLPESELKSKITSICEKTITTEDSLFISICVQEIGYGLVVYSEENFNKARELCSPLTAEYKKECVDYVDLMEQDYKEKFN